VPKLLRSVIAVAACLAFQYAAHAVDPIAVGAAQIDPPTVCCLGIVVPIVQGDDNYNAVVGVEHREAGQTAWQPAQPLLRLRPETISTETPPSGYGLPNPAEGFAGSIFGLRDGTSYDVRLSITDPDGGSSVQTLTTATRAAPRTTPLAPRTVAVANQSQLSAALAAAQAGDVIELAAATFVGSITVTRSGTEENPIIVRGAAQSSVVINASGRTYGIDIRANHVYVERLTVDGSQWGARIMGSTGAVIRRVAFRNVGFGIDGLSGTNRGAYICDNTLQGPYSWPNISSTTWDTEGIVMTGQGHTICHNTLSGFGDALGLRQNSAQPNVAIDFIGNEVLWTSDDGIELDYAHRNVRAIGNRITNAGMGISFQPVWGGPIYVFKNVLVNLAYSPYKLNNEPSGVLIFNNTSIRTVGDGNYGAQAWPQLGYQLPGHWSFAANLYFKNNIAIGVSGPARVTTELRLADLDYNGWSPDGTFVLFDTYSSLADVINRSAYETNSVVLTGPVFANAATMPPNYATLVTPQDVSLRADSNAVDVALRLANINDGHAGSGPDLGALERGAAAPVFGVRPESTTLRPNPPANLTAQ
jgi:hypothetical protein